MSSSSKFAVAVHIMVDLSLCKAHQVRSSKNMALSVNTNPVVIRRIFCELQQAGLIFTKSGKYGGATLAKSAQLISLWEIYSAVDESGVFFHNPNRPYAKCEISCAMHKVLQPVFQSALRAIQKELSHQYLNQLSSRCRRLTVIKRKTSR